MITPDTRTKTYRSRFCQNALIPQLLTRIFDLTDMSVLDFGCGKDAYWVEKYRAEGINIDGIDLSRPDLTPKNTYDIVMLSNVVNVQENVEQLSDLFNEVLKFNPKYILWNYPQSPRKICDENLHTTKNMMQKVLDLVGKTDIRGYSKNCFIITLT